MFKFISLLLLRYSLTKIRNYIPKGKTKNKLPCIKHETIAKKKIKIKN